ncbi:MAG: PIG-L family deacetylase [Paraburkholderia tropica]|uniref:LmbE family N-acetylglucosaminyl deacetylase n=1 Tax=Paraburkholderia tropica TaxID=92647 RepID=A0ABX5MF19_9BURK|nr:PIG-L family deacetylase [Paraburkholderia tropica]MDE1138495.1 PIG-L family deacetylase [Paraburkholderia tropica]PXX06464.1 LmbE family N-acetylglucosaminyl deacetylase [Paraburkholderia tropica]PZW72198.1 LmbE family N-acetylglucosaminyl deacetylase [Paraburkholderia tropica]
MNSGVGSLFVVSPHLDDAVFGCATLLASPPGATVCTVFAGTPRAPQIQPWDAAAGFSDSSAAMRARTREDARALARLGARAIRLPFLDGQYGELPSVRTVARALLACFEPLDRSSLVVPLGLRHPDHLRVADAWLALLRTRAVQSCIVYEDAIHRTVPGITAARLAQLSAAGLRVTAFDASWTPQRESTRALRLKQLAVRDYGSQLQAFGEDIPADLSEPEHFWRVEWPRYQGASFSPRERDISDALSATLS